MSKENTIPLSRPKRLSEVAGLWVGGVLAPIFAVGSLLRRGRVFHPRGVYFQAKVEIAEDVDPAVLEIAEGLAQEPALVRLSTGIYRTTRGALPDLLGLAIRFNVSPEAAFKAQDNSQDLLLLTSKRVLTLPLAMLRTNQRDFLANIYHGMSQFELGDLQNMRLRVVPLTKSGNSKADRYTKIRDAVLEGDVVFQLEAAAPSNPGRWSPLVQVHLQHEVKIDDRATSFWPFRTGQDITPRGFVQFMRPIPYLASQRARAPFAKSE
jgi:hypothetical protein